MKNYLQEDGSREVDGVRYELISMLGNVGSVQVWDYYNPHSNHLITIEVQGDIKESEKFASWSDFEKSYGEADPYNARSQALSFLTKHNYI